MCRLALCCCSVTEWLLFALSCRWSSPKGRQLDHTIYTYRSLIEAWWNYGIFQPILTFVACRLWGSYSCLVHANFSVDLLIIISGSCIFQYLALVPHFSPVFGLSRKLQRPELSRCYPVSSESIRIFLN